MTSSDLPRPSLSVSLMLLLLLLAAYALAAAAAAAVEEAPVVVLVTGSSSGIGKATAFQFAAHRGRNYKVYASMRDVQSVNAWVAEAAAVDAKASEADATVDAASVTDILPANLQLLQLDVTDEESVQRAVQQIIAEEGRVDVLVNNAGYGIAGCLEVVDVQEAKNVFDVNVWGAVRVMQAVLPHMRQAAVAGGSSGKKGKQRPGGHIINISSTSGIRGVPCLEYYTGSKFALEGITDSLRYSLAPFNISVTNVNAGPVKTAFTDRFGHADKGGSGSRGAALNKHGNDSSAAYLNMITGGMIAGLNARIAGIEGQTAEDVAQVVVNVAELKLGAKRLTDVPFNIGSSADSSKLLQEIRRQPTGWGGLYNDILKSMPPLKQPSQSQSPRQQNRVDEEL